MAGRPTDPLNPETPPASLALAEEMRRLRGRTPLREIATRCMTSTSTISRVLGAQVFPRWQMVEAFSEVCGGDDEHLRVLWMRAEEEWHRGKTGREHIRARLSSVERLIMEQQYQINQLQHELREMRATVPRETSL